MRIGNFVVSYNWRHRSIYIGKIIRYPTIEVYINKYITKLVNIDERESTLGFEVYL